MRVIPTLKFQLLCIDIDKETNHILVKEQVILLFESMQVMQAWLHLTSHNFSSWD